MEIDEAVRSVVSKFPEALLPMRERLLANLVMIAQIPAPTGQEAARVLLDRFAEAGLSDASSDEAGNAVGRLVGRKSNRTILLASHLDTIVSVDEDHGVTVQADRILAAGVGDNALGAAIVSLMPAVLEHLGIQLDSDLLLLGTTGSLDRGNHAGIRFFLDHLPQKVDFGICVEGMQLGRLNFFSIGTARADVTCGVRPSKSTSTGPSRSYGQENALIVLNEIINQILTVPLPSRPLTQIRLGKMTAGVSYDTEPDHAELGLEIVSRADEMIGQVCEVLHGIVLEMSARHEVDANLDVFFLTRAGGIPFAHRLVQCVLDVMGQLGIEPDQGHSPSELSELIRRGIPAVTLGITRGEKGRTREPDHVLIEPILTGVAQLLGVLLAIDGGLCDDD